MKRATRRAVVPVLIAIVCVQQRVAVSSLGAVPGLKRTSALSPPGNEGKKEVSALCDAGQHVIGGGGAILGGFGTERLSRLVPEDAELGSKDAFIVRAETPAHHASPFRVAAYAVCADSEGLLRYKIVRDISEQSSASFQTALARCPVGNSRSAPERRSERISSSP